MLSYLHLISSSHYKEILRKRHVTEVLYRLYSKQILKCTHLVMSMPIWNATSLHFLYTAYKCIYLYDYRHNILC